MQICTPNEPRDNKKFWSIKWDEFQGSLLVISFNTAKDRIGINVRFVIL